MSVYIGTSGWHYRHWVGPFYPSGLGSEEMLGYYAGEFDAVEINNSFYKLPDRATLKKWGDATPSGFVFAFWAGAISSWDSSGKDVYCFFDNDEDGYAAQNARQLRDMLTNVRRTDGS